MTSGAVHRVRATVGGLELECVTNDREVADRFAVVALHPTAPAEAPRHTYGIRRERDGILRIEDGEGEVIARTPHAGNAVSRVELDSRGVVEGPHPRGLWIHGAGLCLPDGSALLFVGASGSGKSTATLTLLSRDPPSGGGPGVPWSYLADDAVLLEPATGILTALSWALRLEAAPPSVDALGRLGFRLGTDEWVHDGGERSTTVRIAPPAPLTWAGSSPARLRGCAFLERGPLAVRPLSPGETLLRLWPERVLRIDGHEPWSPGDLAAAIRGIPCIALRTERPSEVATAVDEWTADWGRTAP